MIHLEIGREESELSSSAGRDVGVRLRKKSAELCFASRPHAYNNNMSALFLHIMVAKLY
jgi:hypothetical protein